MRRRAQRRKTRLTCQGRRAISRRAGEVPIKGGGAVDEGGLVPLCIRTVRGQDWVARHCPRKTAAALTRTAAARRLQQAPQTSMPAELPESPRLRLSPAGARIEFRLSFHAGPACFGPAAATGALPSVPIHRTEMVVAQQGVIDADCRAALCPVTQGRVTCVTPVPQVPERNRMVLIAFFARSPHP